MKVFTTILKIVAALAAIAGIGYVIATYRCKYDKETNELISCEKEVVSKYNKRDKEVCKIVDPNATDPTEPEETSSTEDTAPETTEPLETTSPTVTVPESSKGE